MKISFLGATGTVTGSKYLLETGSKKLLIDCGLFQGFKYLRLRNWNKLPINPQEIEAVLLTHAHIDHSGYIPLLVKNGFKGKIYSTEATFDLCSILLPDSGYLQEEEAEYANRHKFSKHSPALPLYTQSDAEQSLRYFSTVGRKQILNLEGVSIKFHYAGHILGASMIEITIEGKSVLFSGDLGRPNDPIMRPPDLVERADYLVIESTYGNKVHDPTDPVDLIAHAINKTVKRNGTILVPAFSVGRTQTLLYYISKLKMSNKIPDIPVYLNSPMGINATRIFCKHKYEHALDESECFNVCNTAVMIMKSEDSKNLNNKKDPMIIIAGSGMATGGRILHHIKTFGTDPRNTILFTGFQAGGTRGEAIINGAKSVKIHGEQVPIKAEVVHVHNMSGHADSNEIIKWIRQFSKPPKTVFITHGEPMASDSLRKLIQEQLNWKTIIVPDYLEQYEIK